DKDTRTQSSKLHRKAARSSADFQYSPPGLNVSTEVVRVDREIDFGLDVLLEAVPLSRPKLVKVCRDRASIVLHCDPVLLVCCWEIRCRKLCLIAAPDVRPPKISPDYVDSHRVSQNPA